MTIFETVIITVLILIFVPLISMLWYFHKFLVKPQKETKKKEKRIIEAKIEQAKIKLENLPEIKIETRLIPKQDISNMGDSLNKLKALRRKK